VTRALLVLAAALPALGDPPAKPHATAHYDLYAPSGDAADIGKLLEALHANLTKYFGRAPKGRLQVWIYEDFDAFQTALREDKQPLVQAGGYYSPDTKKAYLWPQPSAYFTRQLILHEATHQFHYLAATGNRSPSAGWYTEGLAEYFGMHNWDGEELRTGVVPAVTLENYPAKALQQLTDLKDDAEAIGTCAKPVDRPLGWALTHYLVNRHPQRWRALAAMLDEGTKPEKAWEKAIGKAGPEFRKDFRAWLESHPQPLRILWVSWQERGDWIEADSEWCAGAAWTTKPERVEVEVEGLSGTLNAGLMLNQTGGKDFVMVQAREKRVSVVRRAGGADSEIAWANAPAGTATLLAVRDGADWVVTAAGTELARVPWDGDAGLYAEGCKARFRVKK
jgi:hypothetical protein